MIFTFKKSKKKGSEAVDKFMDFYVELILIANEIILK